MKEIHHYVCEICGTEYKDKDRAEKCENGHCGPVKIMRSRFLKFENNQKGYPLSITVLMEDGTEQVYRR